MIYSWPGLLKFNVDELIHSGLIGGFKRTFSFNFGASFLFELVEQFLEV